MKKISIYRDDVWAGDGRLEDDGQIVDCPAVLGPDQEASEETYAAIASSIAAVPQKYRYTGSIEQPDGTYSWRVSA